MPELKESPQAAPDAGASSPKRSGTSFLFITIAVALVFAGLWAYEKSSHTNSDKELQTVKGAVKTAQTERDKAREQAEKTLRQIAEALRLPLETKPGQERDVAQLAKSLGEAYKQQIEALKKESADLSVEKSKIAEQLNQAKTDSDNFQSRIAELEVQLKAMKAANPEKTDQTPPAPVAPKVEKSGDEKKPDGSN